MDFDLLARCLIFGALVFTVGFIIGCYNGPYACPDCPSCSCSAEFHECPPQNVTIIYHNCEALNFSEGGGGRE